MKRKKNPPAQRDGRKYDAFGFSPAPYGQIIVFLSESDLDLALSANRQMEQILRNSEAGVFVAGIKAEAS